MKFKLALAAATAVAVMATAAYAAVTYDPATGGFAGKGDVQLALGMNNAQIQTAVANNALTFTFEALETWEWSCSKEGRNEPVVQERWNISGVNAAVVYDARKVNQVNGFNLAAASGGGEGQHVDGQQLGSCPQGQDWAADGPPVLTGTSGGGLKVNGVPLQ